MSLEILINVMPQQTRVALVEQGVLQELSIERSSHRSIVGNIYLGKIVRVLPGMEAAFVDIGLDQAGFLHLDDLSQSQKKTSCGHKDDEQHRNSGKYSAIQQYLREGQTLLVQVAKAAVGAAVGGKGAQLTTKLSVSSQYLVYLPHENHLGISQRINSEKDRCRLRQELEVITKENNYGGGYILRTAAADLDVDQLVREIQILHQRWAVVTTAAKGLKAPILIHQELPLFLRVIRDSTSLDIAEVIVDSVKAHSEICNFVSKYYPNTRSKIEYYSGDQPIFQRYGVEAALTQALSPVVALKSGGNLVIEYTESMTTIDVNTASFVGRNSLEETAFKTNMEAAPAIAHQLRLRNVGGIIIIDFIDMQDTNHQRQVVDVLKKALENDRAKISVVNMSPLGLVEMTRKRSTESLVHQLCEPCNVCHGWGYAKSVETVCYEILRAVIAKANRVDKRALRLVAGEQVINYLLDQASSHITELEVFLGRTLELQAIPAYSREQFDVILV